MKTNRLLGASYILCFLSIVQLAGSAGAAEIARAWRYDYNSAADSYGWVEVGEADYKDGSLSIGRHEPSDIVFRGNGAVSLELSETGGDTITITSFENASNPKVIFESNHRDSTLNLFWQPKAGVRYRVKFSKTGWGSTHQLYVYTRGEKLD